MHGGVLCTGGVICKGGVICTGGGGGGRCVPEEKGTKASFFWKRPLLSRKLEGLKQSGNLNMAGSCSAVLSRG